VGLPTMSNQPPGSLDESTLFAALSEAAPDGVVIVDAGGVIVYANDQAEALFGYPADELVGRVIEVLVPERIHRAHMAMRDSYVRHPETRPMGTGRDLQARRRDGRTFPVDVSLSSIDTEDGRMVVAFVRDASEWRRRHRQAAATTEISNALLEGRSVEEVLTLTADHARTVVGGDASWIVTPTVHNTLVVRAAAGSDTHKLIGIEVPADASMSGAVMASAAAVVVDSAAHDPRVAEAVRGLGYGPSMYIPLVAAERRFGALIVARNQDEALFSDADVATAHLFAGAAAVALAFGEARQELEQQKVSAEQERIGTELLGRVIHELYAVGLTLQTTVGLVGNEAAGRLEESITRLDDVIKTIRSVVFDVEDR
jgi:PAS domain S-box-containing protein